MKNSTKTSALLSEKALSQTDWPKSEVGGLTLIKSPLFATLPLVHAFTTRHGGQTPEPMSSFNLGRHIDDEDLRADAMTNRARLCTALGLDANQLVVPSQRHTTNIYMIAEGVEPPKLLPEFDGVVLGRNWPSLRPAAVLLP